MVFHRSLGDTQSPQVSRTLLSILAYLNNVVVWIVSTCTLISKSSNPITKPLGSVLSASTIIVIIVTLLFYRFFLLWQSPGIYLSTQFHLFLFRVPTGQQIRQSSRFFFFLLIIILHR